MPHDAVRYLVTVPHREHCLPAESEIEFDHQMALVAGDPPGAGRPWRAPAHHGSRGGHHVLRRGGDRRQLRAGGAATGRLLQVGRAHVPAAVAARRAMLGARVLAAHGALLDLVRCEQCHCLLDTAGPVPPADEAPRRIGAAQMPRAVDLPIDHAHGLMRRADRLAAARALRHLVRAHRLVGAALTILAARRAETPASLRRIRAALLGVPVAHDPAAAAAWREARRAGGVPVLGADPFVGRAMLQAARRTDAHVLVARRLLVHATLRDTMVAAEVLDTDRAARRARLAAAVVVPADHQGRGRTTAMRTREHPSRPTTEGPLGAERRAAPVRGLELPLGALHRSEEHTSELQSPCNLVCRLLLEKKKNK